MANRYTVEQLRNASSKLFLNDFKLAVLILQDRANSLTNRNGAFYQRLCRTIATVSRWEAKLEPKDSVEGFGAVTELRSRFNDLVLRELEARGGVWEPTEENQPMTKSGAVIIKVVLQEGRAYVHYLNVLSVSPYIRALDSDNLYLEDIITIHEAMWNDTH